MINLDKKQMKKLVKCLQNVRAKHLNSMGEYLSSIQIKDDIVELPFEVACDDPVPIPGMRRVGIKSFNLNDFSDRWDLFREVSNVYYLDLKLLVDADSREFIAQNDIFIRAVMDIPHGVQYAFSESLQV